MAISINLNIMYIHSSIKNHHYHLLPNIHEVNTLMMANVIIPLFLLSVFPHQEPRFLLPLLLPIVFTTSKYFSSHYIKGSPRILPIWICSNLIGLIFYGYLHQAGVLPMISYIFKDIKNVSDVHIIHSHIYSVPIGLLMVPQLNESKPYM
jgi:phosphatidylinositol glycan class Z